MKIGDIPFESLKVGDNIISRTGKKGWIGALYPVGTVDFCGRDWDDWGGGILMLWYGYEPGRNPTYSLGGYIDSEVTYLGNENDT